MELKGKILEGMDEDLYHLKAFEVVKEKIETSLWILKDGFYQSNKDLRKTLEQGVDQDHMDEIEGISPLTL